MSLRSHIRGIGRICSLIGAALLTYNLTAWWEPSDVEWGSLMVGVILILIFAITETFTRIP